MFSITGFFTDVKAGFVQMKEDFSKGYNAPTEKEFVVANKIIGRVDTILAERKLFKKMFGGKLKAARGAAVDTINQYNRKPKSVAEKFGKFCAAPFSTLKNWVKSLSIKEIIGGVVGMSMFVGFMAWAASVVGLVSLTMTSITAAASIAFSRCVFIKYEIPAWIECIVDVVLFAMCALFGFYF